MGLVPHRAKDIETKPLFHDALKRRRCPVPADGFYEWKRQGSKKQPYAIGLAEGGLMAFAGLQENWKDPASGEWVRTSTIITTEANPLIAALHDRMPVVLDPADWPTWLGEADDGRDPIGLPHPYPAEKMRVWPVSDRVNSVKNDEGGLMAPLNSARSGFFKAAERSRQAP